MNCKHCKKPIVLVPSAQARADKAGGTAQDYEKLFDYHAACTLALRAESTRRLAAVRVAPDLQGGGEALVGGGWRSFDSLEVMAKAGKETT